MANNPYRNIYAIPGGHYLNWQCGGQVYREAFMNSTYGGKSSALQAAVTLRDTLDACRVYIEGLIGALKLIEPDGQGSALKAALPETRKAVRAAIRKAGRS